MPPTTLNSEEPENLCRKKQAAPDAYMSGAACCGYLYVGLELVYISGQSRCNEYSVSPSPLSFRCQR